MKSILQFIGILLICLESSAQIQITNLSNESSGQIDPYGFTTFKNSILFNARTDALGSEIWVSNGSSSDTRILKDIIEGSQSGASLFLDENFTILNDEFYFIAAQDFYTREQIWKTDGTPEGTSLVVDLDGMSITNLTTVNDHIFFLAKTADYSLEVWKTDGTENGTILIKDGLSIWNNPSFGGSINGIFIFTFQQEGSNHSRVWRSDGTEDGTFALTDEFDGNGSAPGGTSKLSHYMTVNDRLYFVSRRYLHCTDGSNHYVISDLGLASSNLVDYGDAIYFRDKLYLLFYMEQYNRIFIWESDGTFEGTKEVYHNVTGGDFFPSNLVTSNNSLIFCGINENGFPSVIALDPENNAEELVTLTETYSDPTSFLPDLHSCFIYKKSETDFLLSKPDGEYPGWYIDIEERKVSDIDELRDVRYITIFNDGIFFSNSGQLWKLEDSSILNVLVPENQNLLLYPNPSSSIVTISSNGKIEDISIYDLLGNKLDVPINQETAELDISKLPPGSYLIKFKENDLHKAGKITKK